MEPSQQNSPSDSTENEQSILLERLKEKDAQIQSLRKELEDKAHDITNLSNTVKQTSKDLSKVESELQVEKIKSSELEKQIEKGSTKNDMEEISEEEEGEIVEIGEPSAPLSLPFGKSSSLAMSTCKPVKIDSVDGKAIARHLDLPKKLNQDIRNRKRKLIETAPNTKTKTKVMQFGVKAVHEGKNTRPQILPTLPPLVFQFQSTQIKMAMLKEGKPKILENASGSQSTPFVVGLTQSGIFKYGEAVADTDNINQEMNMSQGQPHSDLKEYWWVTDHLLKSGSQAWSTNILLPDGNTRQITVEFLIGFVLKNLKSHVELTLNGTCPVAVITIPMWYSSTQRIQVKDGGRLAGFTHVYLINEASASVFACPSLSNTMLTARNVLVLSENSGQVDASIFSKSYLNKKKRLVMIGHSGHYTEICPRTDEVKCEKAASSSSEEKVKLVQKICAEALQNMQNPKHSHVGGSSHPVELIVFSETKNWKPILEQVGKQVVNVLFHIDKEDDPLVGAAILTGELSQIGRVISDKLAHDVFAKCDSERSAITVIAKDDFRLPIGYELVAHSLPLHCKLVKFFQIGVNAPIEIMNLSIDPSASMSPNRSFVVNLKVTNEGIVIDLSLQSFTCRNSSTMEKVKKEDYSWTTPNLTPEDFERARSLLEYISCDKIVTQEDSYPLHPLTQAKESLLLQCKQITVQLNKGSVTYKSKIVKDAFIKTIQSAVSLTDRPNVTVDELHAQMDILAGWKEKHNMK